MSQYHDQLQQVIGEQEALNDLNAQVTSPEEAEYLKQAQDEITKTRANLGNVATKVVLTPEGTAESQQTVLKEIADGHDRPGPYNGGSRE
jgi:hypothetical protein